MKRLCHGFSPVARLISNHAGINYGQKAQITSSTLTISTVNVYCRAMHTAGTGSAASDALGADQLVRHFGSLANHADLDLARLLSAPQLIEDTVSQNQEDLLRAALQDALPSFDHVSQAYSRLPIGHQQVHFRPRLRQADLLPDGTDTRFLPGPASIWQYRLWAGGAVSLVQPHHLIDSPLAIQQEIVEDVRIVGTTRPERVFISIRKEISTANVAGNETSRSALKVPTYASASQVVERYTLCFLREPPGTTGSAKIITPPTAAMFTHTLRPDANLLFQFSALTHNAHKIHLDPAYAQRVYGLRAPVVHGPLMMILMVDYINIVLQSISNDVQLTCQHMDYRNFAPLYVDEQITLCCKPSKLDQGQELIEAKEWQVWIQSGSGVDASLAVRGTAKVSKLRT